MLIIIKTNDTLPFDSVKEEIENIIKRISDVEDVKVFTDDEISINKKIPVFSEEQLIALLAKEKENGKNI